MSDNWGSDFWFTQSPLLYLMLIFVCWWKFQVQAAYKRALFKFHPDRASKTDVRAQVEAEEKFKLISRLKD